MQDSVQFAVAGSVAGVEPMELGQADAQVLAAEPVQRVEPEATSTVSNLTKPAYFARTCQMTLPAVEVPRM